MNRKMTTPCTKPTNITGAGGRIDKPLRALAAADVRRYDA